MVVTTYGKNQITLLLGGSISTIPEYTLIGTGSGTESVAQSGLITPVDRQPFTASSYPTQTSIKYQTDWNSIEMSGIQLKEFGITGSATTVSGLVYTRNSLPSLNFDGTNELRLEEVISIY